VVAGGGKKGVRTMLLNDVPDGKKLAYLLGLQVERHGLGSSTRSSAVRVTVTAVVVTGLLLLSLLLTAGLEWH
jgi:hypothetical protein